MLKSWRLPLLAAACSLGIMVAASTTLRAEEPASVQEGSSHTAPAAKPMADCPYAKEGECCGACQEMQKQGKAVDPAQMDCPCAKAKKAAEGS